MPGEMDVEKAVSKVAKRATGTASTVSSIGIAILTRNNHAHIGVVAQGSA